MLDLSDAPEQRADGATIPDGTYAKVVAQLRPGGVDGVDEIDRGLLRQSQTSDARMLDFEFTVSWPPAHAKKKFWQLMTVTGGKVDEKGSSIAWNITKTTLRAMIDSALGLDPSDNSAATIVKRQVRGFSDFDRIEFVARIGVEVGGDNGRGGTYADKNTLSRVVTPDTAEWQKWGAKPAAASAQAPLWGNSGSSAPPVAGPAGPAKGPAWLNG
jgi:hypothetical protein